MAYTSNNTHNHNLDESAEITHAIAKKNGHSSYNYLNEKIYTYNEVKAIILNKKNIADYRESNIEVVQISLIDWDGCIAGREHPDIFSQSGPLINEIKKQAVHRTAKLIITGFGTNRQSAKMDALNRDCNKNGSCFHGLPAITMDLKHQLSTTDIIVKCDPCLLADVYNGLERGTSFRQALEIYHHEVYPNGENQPHWLFDESKFTLLYFKLHEYAAFFPHAKLYIDFYDDKESLLVNLYDTLLKNLDLIPSNILLTLQQYESGSFNNADKKILTGKGCIDHDPGKSILWLAYAYLNKPLPRDSSKPMPLLNSDEISINYYNALDFYLFRQTADNPKLKAFKEFRMQHEKAE